MKNKNELTRSQIVLIKIGVILCVSVLIYGSNMIYKIIKYNSVEVVPLRTGYEEPIAYDVEGLSDEEIDKIIKEKRGEQ